MILLRLQVIKLFLCISTAPAALDRYLEALPAMSLIPFAPFPYSYQPNATRPSEIAFYKSYIKLFLAMYRQTNKGVERTELDGQVRIGAGTPPSRGSGAS